MTACPRKIQAYSIVTDDGRAFIPRALRIAVQAALLVFAGGHAGVFFEHLAEIAFVGIAAGRADFRQGAAAAVAKEGLRLFHAGAGEKGGKVLPGFLMEKCPGKDGARQLRRLVQSEVEGPLASFLLRCSRKPSRVKLRMEGGELSFCT